MSIELDSIFTTPPVFDDSYYGEVIHEIREMQIVDMGQYAHGNQPIQHMIYLYDWAGAPWKTQYHARDVMSRLYSADARRLSGRRGQRPDLGLVRLLRAGLLSGNAGGRPICDRQPAVPQRRGPDDAGRQDADDRGGEQQRKNVYIQSVTLNGKAMNETCLTHDGACTGGTLRFVMGPVPNKEWGAAMQDAPFSMSAPLAQALPVPASP